MPCNIYDGLDPREEYIAFLEASLCGVLRAGVDNNLKLFEKIDFYQAGVGRAELNRWWRSHSAKDRKRKNEIN